MIETRGPVFFVVMTTLAACAGPELPEVAPPSDSPEVTVEEAGRGVAPQSTQGASSALGIPPPPAPAPSMAPPASAAMMAAGPSGGQLLQRLAYGRLDRERYESSLPNPVTLVSDTPISTFLIDVDTASLAVVRRSLRNETLPPRDAVRVEELINYFDYDYPIPEDRDAPFSISTTVMPTPWNSET